MPAIQSKIDVDGETFRRNRAQMLALIARAARARGARARQVGRRPSRCSTGAASCCRASAWRGCSTSARRGWSSRSIAGYGLDTPDLDKSVPGGGMIAGIGYVSGVRCLVVASDTGIDAGAIQHMGREKLLRAQELALDQQAALRAPGRIRRRQPAQVPRRGLHPRRRDLPQSGEALGRRHSGRHRGARLVDGGRRLHAGPVRLRHHGARPRQGLPRRPAAAESRDRRDRDRRGARRRRDAHPCVGARRISRRGRRRRRAPRARGDRAARLGRRAGAGARPASRRATRPRNCSASSRITASRSTCAR